MTTEQLNKLITINAEIEANNKFLLELGKNPSSNIRLTLLDNDRHFLTKESIMVMANALKERTVQLTKEFEEL